MHNLGVVCIVHNKLERKNIHLGECPIKHVGYGSCTLSDCRIWDTGILYF